MIFNKHLDLRDKHSLLSPSKFYWLNYDREKLVNYYANHYASLKGTELHAFAAQCIRLNQKLAKSKKTLNAYVNDAIGYKMIPEQILYYSEHCFGTADAISFRNGLLRIHDLKTGTVPAHMEQLMVYAALFCLEYVKNPKDLQYELRIYQNNDVVIANPDPLIISDISRKIVKSSAIIDKIKAQEE